MQVFCIEDTCTVLNRFVFRSLREWNSASRREHSDDNYGRHAIGMSEAGGEAGYQETKAEISRANKLPMTRHDSVGRIWRNDLWSIV